MIDETTKARGFRGFGLLGAALALVIAAAPPAAAQSISGASVSTSGSTGNSGDSDGSRRSSVAIQINDGTTLKSRFAWNLSSDVGAFSTRDTNGSAHHNVNFNVTAPGAYFLTVATQRTGDINRRNDVAGCDGAADISSVGGSQSGGALTPAGSLNLSDPGGIGNGGSDTSIPFNQTNSARIDQVSNGVAKAHALDFTWSGTTRSNSCEAAVRVGEGSSVSGCDACAYPGSPSRNQANDGHFVTVTLTSLCGNGTVDAAEGEECDLGGQNGSSTSCCTSACQFRASGQTCRPSVGVCDLADTCTGGSATCPADAKSTAQCRASAGVCDIAEFCNGVSNNCPGDFFQPASVECRGSAGVCDPAENCTGSGPSCPGDAKSTAECRASAGLCDVAESCDGVGNDCPADGFASGATVCRGSAGVCDLAESCTGSGPACPADAKSTAECRGSAGVCDVAESCDGVGNDCPADGFQSSATECRGSAGVCDLAESCTGSGPACPIDAKSTAECRAAADVCDVAESCDGVNDDCPTDEFAPGTTECRAVAGDCDLAETCTGTGAACPADQFKSASVECRADAGQCDVAESCTGTGADCPADGFEVDGTGCDDVNVCTIDDICVTGECVGDSMTCGDSVVQDTCGEQCDDGNLDPDDGCSPICLVEPGLGCTTTPLAGCRQPFSAEKASVVMKDKSPKTDKNLFKWKWIRGERTTVAEFGDPLTASTNYQLCVYDQTGLLTKANAPGGGLCGSNPKPCWKATGIKGFRYKDKDLTPDGIQKMILKEGADGKAKILVNVKGALFDMPDLGAIQQPLTIQIQNTSGLCWEAVYSAPPKKQTPEQFKDKAD